MSILSTTRAIWQNGLNVDLVQKWRRAVDRKVPSEVYQAGRAAAIELRECRAEGPLPVSEAVLQAALRMEIDPDELVSYLASLGMGLLVSLSPSED